MMINKMWRLTFVCPLIWMILLESSILTLQQESNQQPDEIEAGDEGRGGQARIVGGREVQCEDFPYQINFIVNNSYFCGGFIVSERYILTAAHCAQDVDPSTVVLRAGSTYRTNGTIIPVEEVIPFPEYNDPPFDKDIAIIKTAEPIEYNECIQPIPLPEKGESPEPGSSMLVSGWGRTMVYQQEGAPTLPDHLMAVNLTIIKHKYCEIVYYGTFTDNMICAGNFFLGGKSACQGDSGGVGVVNGVAHGIVSFGRICGAGLSPTVFADISSPILRDFVTELTGL